MDKKRSGKLRKVTCGVSLGLVILCLAGAGISALSNRSLLKGSMVVDRLDPLDKARLEEALHLKAALGEAVWPGLGGASIPVSLHNQNYSFLTGFEGKPPAGWEDVEGETFGGKPYYRKAEKEAQNLQFRSEYLGCGGELISRNGSPNRRALPGFLPPVIEQIFSPAPAAPRVQIGVLHGSFHVFQAQTMERLEVAESASSGRQVGADSKNSTLEGRNEPAGWALGAKSDEKRLEPGRRSGTRQRCLKLISARANRHERQLEWEEGLAKYAELEFLGQAFFTKDYQPSRR
jgi:hypothetical protein